MAAGLAAHVYIVIEVKERSLCAGYLDPEFFETANVTDKSDVYALGKSLLVQSIAESMVSITAALPYCPVLSKIAAKPPYNNHTTFELHFITSRPRA